MTSPAAAVDLPAVFAHVDANRQAFLDRLIDYLRRPSISAEGLGVAETAAFVAVAAVLLYAGFVARPRSTSAS